jgi:hypothetical protein
MPFSERAAGSGFPEVEHDPSDALGFTPEQRDCVPLEAAVDANRFDVDLGGIVNRSKRPE